MTGELSNVSLYSLASPARAMGNLELLRILYGRAWWLSVAQGFLWEF
jgi:hypothetical protein